MATLLRCLVIENESDWQEYLKRPLESLGGTVSVETAANARAARALLRKQDSFDLATIDISLLRPRGDGTVDGSGLQLVEQFFRQSPETALLVVTGHSTAANTRKLLRDRVYRVFDVVEKSRFNRSSFLRRAREALLDARIRQAQERVSRRFHLTVAFGRESWLGCELHGPDFSSPYRAEHPVRFAASDLARRGDQIDLLLRDPQTWRQEVTSVGEATRQALQGDRRIAENFTRAKAVSDPQNPLWIEFSGPASGLGIPFELIWDEGDRLCLKHLLTRRLVEEDGAPSRKTDSFRRFVEKLASSRTPLRALLVSADPTGKLPEIKKEVETLAAEIKIEASRLGLRPEVVLLLDPAASDIQDALVKGEFHIFHYAGHGYYNSALPERSGLFLGEDQDIKATDLHLLIGGAPLQLAFLSCCVSARTARESGHGDFRGVFDGLAQADVPAVLGYRWTVGDAAATQLAQAFYRSLWRTLSPPQALFEARRVASMGPLGRDDETWASPILLCQTE